VGLAAVLLVTMGSHRQRVAAGLLAGMGAAAAALALGAVMLGVDVFLSRYLIASLVPLIAAVAVGLTGTSARWVGVAAVAAVGAVSLTAVVAVARDPDLQRADWAGVADVFVAEVTDSADATDAADGDGARILVVDAYGNLAGPLLHYLDHEARSLDGDQTVRADRIDVVVAEPVTKPCNWFVGRACALVFLGAPLPEPLASEFTLVERVDLGPLAVARYQAPHAVPITPEALVGPDRVAGTLVLAAD
jgi:hypothetical protein